MMCASASSMQYFLDSERVCDHSAIFQRHAADFGFLLQVDILADYQLVNGLHNAFRHFIRLHSLFTFNQAAAHIRDRRVITFNRVVVDIGCALQPVLDRAGMDQVVIQRHGHTARNVNFLIALRNSASQLSGAV